jgi:alcohol dehydrogenase class IV
MTFSFSTVRKVSSGVGKIQTLPEAIRIEGERSGHHFTDCVLIVGESSFKKTPDYEKLRKHLEHSGLVVHEFSISGEPSPERVDSAVLQLCSVCGIQRILEQRLIVVSIGGGSVIDTGKAISAMAPLAASNFPARVSVQDYLEGVGTKNPPAFRLPLIACPTTAGTGSEATKNAVLSYVGKDGFKKSLRNDQYIPDQVILDPQLT